MRQGEGDVWEEVSQRREEEDVKEEAEEARSTWCWMPPPLVEKAMQRTSSPTSSSVAPMGPRGSTPVGAPSSRRQGGGRGALRDACSRGSAELP